MIISCHFWILLLAFILQIHSGSVDGFVFRPQGKCRHPFSPDLCLPDHSLALTVLRITHGSGSGLRGNQQQHSTRYILKLSETVQMSRKLRFRLLARSSSSLQDEESIATTAESKNQALHLAEVGKAKDGMYRSQYNNSTAFFVADETTKDFPLRAVSLLNIVAVIWGTQHAIIKMVVDDSSAAPFTFLRFALAALIAAPYTPGAPWNPTRNASFTEKEYDIDNVGDIVDDTKKEDALALRNTWRWGLEMGIWMFLGFSFQAIGIASTTAQRSGFLLYLNVKLVPFFSRFPFGKPIGVATWISALVAFVGTSMLALDGQSIGFNIGDVWSIAAAAASAMFILRLDTASQAVPKSTELNSASLWVVSMLAGTWTLLQGLGILQVGEVSHVGLVEEFRELQGLVKSHPWEFIYLSGVTTALANYIQTKAQKDITPEKASIIYSLDPVYGALFSWILLGEQLGGAQAYIGAGLVTIAAAVNALGAATSTKDEAEYEGLPITTEDKTTR